MIKGVRGSPRASDAGELGALRTAACDAGIPRKVWFSDCHLTCQFFSFTNIIFKRKSPDGRSHLRHDALCGVLLLRLG